MRKNVASQKVGAQLVSATDGSAFTGSVTVYVTGDAGTQAAGSVGSGACTHEGNGYHTYAPAQAETNYDLIAFTFTGTGAVPVTLQVYTLPTTGVLAPTVADRTLDVSSTGEAGVDWANVGSPTTTLNLSGTTVKTATDVETDTADIQSRLPAALVSGKIDANISYIGGAALSTSTAQLGVNVVNFGGSAGTFASGIPAVNATQISGDTTAADNVESAFDDTAGAVSWMGILDQGTAQSATASSVTIRAAAAFADNSINGSVIAVYGSDQGYWQVKEITASSGDVFTNNPDWTVTPTGTITYKIFAGPPALSTLPAVNVTQLGGDSQSLTDLKDFADAGYDPSTNKVQGLVLADAVTTVNGLASNVVTAASTASDFITEVQTACSASLAAINLDHLISTAVDTNFATTVHLDSVIGHLADNGTSATFDRTTDSLEVLGAATAPSAASIADAVWDEAIAGHVAAGSTGEALNAAGGAGDPWITSLPGSYTAGQAGYILGTNLNATVSSRLASASYTAPLDAAGTRSAVGLASANLDTQLGTIDTNVDSVLADTNELQTDWANGGRLDLLIDSILADTGTDGVAISAATANQIADALLDRTAGVETNRTPRQALRLVLAALVGKLSGAATTTVTIRDTNDTADRITATVDADGNRSTVTLNAG